MPVAVARSSCVFLSGVLAERLKANYYVNKRLFIADMKRMLANCKAYNAPETEYYKSANLLDKFFQNKLKDHGLVEKV